MSNGNEIFMNKFREEGAVYWKRQDKDLVIYHEKVV